MATAKEKVDIVVTAKGTETSKKKLGGVEKSINSMAKSALTGIASFYALKKAYDITIGSAAQFEKVGRQMDAVLKSTKNAAGMTKKELLNLADSFQNVTTYSNTSIMEAENLILTFTKIGKRIMPDAIETVLNMSTALGQDLKSSAIQVGKALNDPITGATALRRVGVSLTDQQIKQIKVLQENNDLFGAQKIILDELATEFGGAARAGVNSFYGAVSQVTNIISDLGRSIGDKALPAISGLLGGIVKLMQVPLSKKIASERMEFNALITVLKDTNTHEEVRKNIIKKLNDSYSNYLPNLITEKTSTEDLAKAQEKGNEQFLKKIQLQAAEEQLIEITKKGTDAIFEMGKAQTELAKKYGKTIDEGREVLELQRDLRAEQNFIVDKTLTKLITGYDTYSKQLSYSDKELKIFTNSLNEHGISLTDLHSGNKPIITDNDTIIEQNKTLLEQQMKMMGIGAARTPIAVSPIIELTEMEESKKACIREDFRNQHIAMIHGDYELEQVLLQQQTFLFERAGLDKLKISKWLSNEQQKLNIKTAQNFAQGLATNIESARKGGLISATVAKRAAQASASVDTYAAANKALAAYPPPWSFIAAAAATAAGLANVAIIEKTKYAKGGIIPGSGNQDNVPIMATPGELILNLAQQESLASQMGTTINVNAIMDAEAFKILLRTGGTEVLQNEMGSGRL